MRARVAHISDLHFDERDRLDDLCEVLARFELEALEAGVDLVVVGGDVFERASSALERNVSREWFVSIASRWPVVVVKGNHDAPGELDVLKDLRTVHGIVPVAAPVFEGWRVPNTGAAVFVLPWFDKAHMMARLDLEGTDAPTRDRMVVEKARELLRTYAPHALKARTEGVVPILLAHVQVAGSRTSTGQTLIGRTVELGTHDLFETGCAYVALGHVHKPQWWGWSGETSEIADGMRDGDSIQAQCVAAYSGSPDRQNYGEPEPKGWIIADCVVGPDGSSRVEALFSELPARRMVRLELDAAAARHPEVVREGMLQMDEAPNQALVRLRVTGTPAELAKVNEDALRAELADAYEVKVELVPTTEERVRSEEIVSATNTRERVEAYWNATAKPDPETADRVLGNLDSIEAEEEERDAVAET